MYNLPDSALIDMGDFVGGMLKYLRAHPIPHVTIAGGVGKMTKLAQGLLDLHSARGSVELPALATLAREAGGSEALAARIAGCNTAAEAFSYAQGEGIALGDAVAKKAWTTAAAVLRDTPIELEIAVFDRDGTLVGHASPERVHD
jgi:cobalt-precorrin-5B (C1)-methyltransferase